MIRPLTQSRGFTFIELVVVLIIIAIVMALAAPTLSGFGQGQKLRNSADQFVATTGYARSQAVATAAPYAVVINSSDNTFVVQTVDAGGTRANAPGDAGVPVKLPTDFTIKLTSGGADSTPGAMQTSDGEGSSGGSVLLFYPDSRSTPGVIEIESPAGEKATIESKSPAESFRRTDQTQTK